MRSVAVTLHLPGEQDTHASAEVKEWPSFDRFKRASLMLCICWAAAGVCIFFPIVHFALVPGFLLAGPVLFVLKFTEAATLEALKGSCPRCRKDGVWNVGGRFKPRRNVTCDGCGNLMELSAG